MTRVSCQELRADWDAYQERNLETAIQESFDEHLNGCPACREFQDTLEGAKDLVEQAEIDPILKRRLMVAIDRRDSLPPRIDRRGKMLALTLVPVAAAAALLLLFFGVGGVLPADTETTAIRLLRGREHIPAAEHRADVNLADTSKAPSSTPLGPPPALAKCSHDRLCFDVFDGTALWVDPDAEVRLLSHSEQVTRFYLTRGHVVAEIGAHRAGYRFIVETPCGAVEARGTVFGVTATEHTECTARVLEGVVEVRSKGSSSVLLTAGQGITLGESVPVDSSVADLQGDRCLAFGSCEQRRVEPSTKGRTTAAASPRNQLEAEQAIRDNRLEEASRLVEEVVDKSPGAGHTRDLLAQLARAYRRAKLFDPAASTYRRLLESFPSSDAATNGLVALAQIELDALGQSTTALIHFEEYLRRAPSGYLSEAARAGRVRALVRIGDTRKLESAVADYLQKHRGGFFVAEMLCHLGEARARSGRCDLAVEDFKKVVARWPRSREARRARQGLGACGETP